MKKRVNESRIIERTKCSRSVAKAASHLKILGDVFLQCFSAKPAKRTIKSMKLGK